MVRDWPPLSRILVALSVIVGTVACSESDAEESIDGPLNREWETDGSVIAHGITWLSEGEAATLGFRPFANPSAVPFVITNIELEETRGVEVIDFVALTPERRRSVRGATGGFGVSSGFPPAIVPKREWKFAERMEGATVAGLDREPNERRDLWDPMVGLRLTAEYGAARNVIVEYEWRSDTYTARLPFIFLLDSGNGSRFDDGPDDPGDLSETPIEEWPGWDD